MKKDLVVRSVKKSIPVRIYEGDTIVKVKDGKRQLLTGNDFLLLILGALENRDNG